MTPALTPELAVAYVRELSADVRGVVVLDARGAGVAGHHALAAPARGLVEAAARIRGHPVDAAIRLPQGVVFAASTDTHAVVAAAGPLSLVGPTAQDVRTAVDALTGSSSGPAPDDVVDTSEVLRSAAEAVILATRGAF